MLDAQEREPCGGKGSKGRAVRTRVAVEATACPVAQTDTIGVAVVETSGVVLAAEVGDVGAVEPIGFAGHRNDLEVGRAH